MPDIHFIWQPANWSDRPIRALRAFHGSQEYLVGLYGFNARCQSRWFAHRTFIFCGRQSSGLTGGPLLSTSIRDDAYRTIDFILYRSSNSSIVSAYLVLVKVTSSPRQQGDYHSARYSAKENKVLKDYTFT
jgi:hypothetical protein